MTDHKSYIEVRDSIELLASMIEMTYCLQYKYEDHTTAIMFIDAQLEKSNAHASFAREQDRLEMIRILHAARVESGNCKVLDLELWLNQVGGIFKPDEDGQEDDVTLQAALTAQVGKTNYENSVAVLQERTVPKKNSDSRNQ
jgi:hypothetical protein